MYDIHASTDCCSISSVPGGAVLNLNKQLKLWQILTGWLLVLVAVLLLILLHYFDKLAVIPSSLFLPFHTVSELFAVIIAALIFVTGYRAIGARRSGAVILLGIFFLGVSLFDLLHLLTYKGMPAVITENTAHKTIVFWLSARFMTVTALLLYVSLPTEITISASHKKAALLLLLTLVSVIGYIGLAVPETVPAFFIEDYGLTRLKIVSEYAIVILCLATLLILIKRWRTLYDESHHALVLTIILFILSELFFTTYAEVTDIANAFGHIYKILSYIYLFQATVIQAFNRPLIKLKEDEQREKAIIDSAHMGVLLVDQHGTVLRTNPAMEQLTGYHQQEIIGSNIGMFLPEHLHGKHSKHILSFFNDPSHRSMNSVDGLALLKKDSTRIPVDISLGYWYEAEQPRAVAFVTDITEKVEFEEKLLYQATHDELTGLANRWLYIDRLGIALEHAKRNKHTLAVLLLDLDNFKVINDSYGHATGDLFLKNVADRFVDALRSEDTIARLGGDEFAIFLPGCHKPDEAAIVANKLIASLDEPIANIGQAFSTSVSIGVTLYPQDADSAEELVRLADMAMYQAKNAGRGSYAFYASYLDVQVHENAIILPRLKEAIENDWLELYYQPEISIADNSIIGVEALLRWHEPDIGPVPPSRFIPLAEASGLILHIDQWTLNHACQQIRNWMDSGMRIRVAVNFSAHQFRHTNLVNIIKTAIDEYNIDASLLELEITETAAMHDPLKASEQLSQIVKLGVCITLDDFGTGYSSLAYLKRLPFNKIKIDGRFIRDIVSDNNDTAIVQAIIALARSLDLGIVAECVEKREQLELLRQYGCDSYQGFYYSPAISATDLQNLFNDLSAKSNISNK